MLFQIKGICQNCAEDANILVHNGLPKSRCSSCDEDPFEIETITGVVYIINNDNQKGLKIGQTSKTVEQRCKQLASTGVPGTFHPIAIFPSTNPKKHEKRAHDKLLNKNLAKEHFDLEPVEAVLSLYRTFNKKIMPIFYDENIKERFFLELELAKIEMKIKLKGKK